MPDLDRLLQKTSRTFALSIPKLPDPPRREVAVAYLLFRIADTFEDAASWPRERRLEALEDFAALAQAPEPRRARELTARWVAQRPSEDEGYLELLGQTPEVLGELERSSPARRAAIVKHTVRTAQGMAGFVRQGDAAGSLRLADVPALKAYCYVVAGIVGELLTDLFVDVSPEARSVEAALREREVAFGEGLQLVNILKDADDDARDGRVYLPRDVPRREVLSLARGDLARAAEYVLALQRAGAPRGLVEFTALPVLLARASLDVIERDGPGSKVSRLALAAMMGKLHNDLEAGAPAVSVPVA